MKVLIVGAGGQVGRALKATAPPKFDVTALTRDKLDITDANAVARVMRSLACDIIINAAAYTAVDRAEAEPELAFKINCEAPEILARSAAATGARFVHISTDFVFGGHQAVAYKPSDQATPLNKYGESKLAGERAIEQSLHDSLIVRTAWVYSVHGSNFVKTMLRLMAERDEVRVVADQIGTPTHAQSLAQALWKLIEARTTGILHYTNAGAASWYDFAVAIQEDAAEIGLLKRVVPILPINSEEFPTPAKRPAFSLLDKSDTYRLIGIAPHWREELRRMLQNLKEKGNG